uniref:Uncharacterized protein n=1 Tax=Anguilla anguilla TaxID=7936 RepID=A0A0E9XLP8_ANGAN
MALTHTAVSLTGSSCSHKPSDSVPHRHHIHLNTIYIQFLIQYSK